MGLRLIDGVREKLSVELYAFFEPHGTTDATFDEICGWTHGATRELLDKTRDPSDRELVEICLRFNQPISWYVRCVMPDGSDKPIKDPAAKCTDSRPCCDHRLESCWNEIGQRTYFCPNDCMCHS
jgi:hypothetical protein